MKSFSLNSFEFYLFTWAAYIVQPYSPDNRLVAGESLYPYILEDYLGKISFVINTQSYLHLCILATIISETL